MTKSFLEGKEDGAVGVLGNSHSRVRIAAVALLIAATRLRRTVLRVSVILATVLVRGPRTRRGSG